MSLTEATRLSVEKVVENFYGHDIISSAAQGEVRRMQMLVRRPSLEDVDDMIALGQEMHSESPHYRDVPFDVSAARTLVTNGLQTPSVFAEVGTFDNKIVAMIALQETTLMFAPVKMAVDILFFVKPEFRYSLFAPRLIHDAQKWSRQRGHKYLVMGVTTGVHTERTVELYRRLGFTNVGTIMRKEF